MKYLLAILLILVTVTFAQGQVQAGHQLLKGSSKSRLYYVDVKNNEATVYTMGRYLDVAGKGYSIMKTDTLPQQADGSYTGRQSRIILEENVRYLVNITGKTRKCRLDSISLLPAAYNQLNNAYYLDHYFAMAKQLNKTFPLNHHSFRDAFFIWQAFPTAVKEMDYQAFRGFADNQLQQITDSITHKQDKYTRLTNHIIKSIQQIDYAALRDSVAQLPAEYAGKSQYYSKVMNTVVVSQPEYFLRLAEDFPHDRSLIFSTVADNKQARTTIESVTGHDDTRNAFLKVRREYKSLPYKAIGIAALGAGLLILIGIHLFK